MSAPFPCPNPPTPCETSPNPLTGFSSESTDSTTFIGLAWNGGPPPLNKPFNLVPCEAIADSQVSQVDADRLAQNAAVTCASSCTLPFGNTAQTATGACSDGTPYSLTVPAGAYLAENQVLANRLAFTAAARALRGHFICLGSLSPSSICLNIFYFGQISILNTDSPAVTHLVMGELPSGLSLISDGDRVVLQGTPTAVGVYQFTLTSTNSLGVVTTKAYEVTVGGITTASPLPDAFGGTPYSQSLIAFNPNSLSTEWSIVAGSLPSGLSLGSGTGIISGTITQSGTFAFTVRAEVGSNVCEKTFSMNAQAINWGAMVWSNIFIKTPAGGSASGSFSGANLSSSTAGGPGDYALVNALGTVTYSGPLAPCKITVVTTAGPGSVMGFEIYQDGVPKLVVDNTQIGVPGNYVFNFTIAATAGSTITIKGKTGTPAPGSAFTYCADTVPLAAFSALLSNA